MDAIKGLKEKLEAVTTEASIAKDMHDAAIKAKDGACACASTFAQARVVSFCVCLRPACSHSVDNVIRSSPQTS